MDLLPHYIPLANSDCQAPSTSIASLKQHLIIMEKHTQGQTQKTRFTFHLIRP